MSNRLFSSVFALALMALFFSVFAAGCRHLDVFSSMPGLKPAPFNGSPSSQELFSYIRNNGHLPNQSAGDAEQDYAALNKAWDKFQKKYEKYPYFSYRHINDLGRDIIPVAQAAAKIEERIKAHEAARTGRAAQVRRRASTNIQTPADGRITIPPYSLIEWSSKGYCLDPNRPAPQANEKFQMMPAGELISADLLPVYGGFIKLARTDREAQRYQQQIVWAMRTADQGSSWVSGLGAEQRAVLDRSYPNGSALLDKAAATGKGVKTIKEFLGLDQLEQAVSGLQYSFRDVQSQMNQLANMVSDEAIQDTGYEYSEIADGVYARVVGTGALAAKFSVLNTNAAPFNLVVTDHVLEPQRKVQRMTVEIPPSVKVDDVTPAGGDDTYAQDRNALDDLAGKIENQAVARAVQSLADDWDCTKKGMLIGVRDIPFVGLIIDSYAVHVGKDPMTGEPLSRLEQQNMISQQVLSVYKAIDEIMPIDQLLQDINATLGGRLSGLMKKILDNQGVSKYLNVFDKLNKASTFLEMWEASQKCGANRASRRPAFKDVMDKKDVAAMESILEQAEKAGVAF